jgi:sec-independent protein translocase protein TatA
MAFLSPSPMELIVILVIALLVLGPAKLPETARSLGRGVRELRESIQGHDFLGDDRHTDDSAVRADDPGGLPVDPAVVMGNESAELPDDDLPAAELPERG